MGFVSSANPTTFETSAELSLIDNLGANTLAVYVCEKIICEKFSN